MPSPLICKLRDAPSTFLVMGSAVWRCDDETSRRNIINAATFLEWHSGLGEDWGGHRKWPKPHWWIINYKLYVRDHIQHMSTYIYLIKGSHKFFIENGTDMVGSRWAGMDSMTPFILMARECVRDITRSYAHRHTSARRTHRHGVHETEWSGSPNLQIFEIWIMDKQNLMVCTIDPYIVTWCRPGEVVHRTLANGAWRVVYFTI